MPMLVSSQHILIVLLGKFFPYEYSSSLFKTGFVITVGYSNIRSQPYTVVLI